jgi:hypothetical protein
MPTPLLSARNADLQTLHNILLSQDHAKLDLTTRITNLSVKDGIVTIAGTSVFDDGARFVPTAIADGHFAEKLGVPVAYLRRLREQRLDLYDANVNGWVQGVRNPAYPNFADTEPEFLADPDRRTVTVRLFQGDPGELGVMRAMLSDRFGIIDNLDVTVAALQGIADAGIHTEILACDLTEGRMMIKVAAPDIFVKAPRLLENYRSPFKGRNLPEWARRKFGVDGDGMFAGFVLTNSETGGGAYNLTARVGVLSCLNGMMRTQDAMKRRHVGSKLEEGVIEWSDETYKKTLDLITAQTTDAVRKFLSEQYLNDVVAEIEGRAGTEIEGNAADAVQVVARQVGFTDAQRDGILDHFIRGGQMTAGGIMQATTSFAQELEDADVAYEMEVAALKVLEVAAALPAGRSLAA